MHEKSCIFITALFCCKNMVFLPFIFLFDNKYLIIQRTKA